MTDKLDGSLGIVYPCGDNSYAVATRGSFTSDQAVHATHVLRSRYRDYRPPAGITTLVEIIYPQNRIVLDYGDTDDLVLLGGVDITSGASVPPCDLGWPGPYAAILTYTSLRQALAAPPRPNAEGLVVYCPATDDQVKIKQDDYIALHRIVTGLNTRTVWEHLAAGKPLDDLITPLPDEFHPWCRHVAADLNNRVEQRMADIHDAYHQITADLPDGFTRRDFAAVAVTHPDKWALFLLLDGRDPLPELWRQVKPEAITPAGYNLSEDTPDAHPDHHPWPARHVPRLGART